MKNKLSLTYAILASVIACYSEARGDIAFAHFFYVQAIIVMIANANADERVH